MKLPSPSAAVPDMDRGSFLILTFLGLYSHIDATTPKGAPGWHYVYGALLVAVAVVGVFGRARGKSPNVMVWALGVMAVVGAATAVQQDLFYPGFFLGDIAKMLAPIVFWWAAQRWPQLFSSEKSARYLFWWLMTAALCAPLYASTLAPYAEQFKVATDERGRYDPPHPVLIAILWFYVLRRPSFMHFALLGICAILAFFSQQRTNALLIPILGALAIMLEWHRLTDAAKRIHFWTATAVVLCGIGIAAILPMVLRSSRDLTQEILFYTRFGLFEQGADRSTTNRFLEANDVLYDLNQQGPLPWILGMGHGATFTKFEANPESNTTDENVVHHVHIGPLQIQFRYGIIGLVLLVLYGLLILGRFLQMWTGRVQSLLPERMWLVGLVGVGIMFVIFGVLQDPLLSFAVGASMAYSGTREPRTVKAMAPNYGA